MPSEAPVPQPNSYPFPWPGSYLHLAWYHSVSTTPLPLDVSVPVPGDRIALATLILEWGSTFITLIMMLAPLPDSRLQSIAGLTLTLTLIGVRGRVQQRLSDRKPDPLTLK